MIGQSGAAWMDADDACVRACVSVGRARDPSGRVRSRVRFVSFRFESSRVFLDGDDDVDDDDGDANANAGIDDDSWATRRGGVRTRGDDASRARARCGGERRCDANGVWWRVGRREGGGNGTRDIHSFIHSFNSLSGNAHLSNRSIVAARLGRMDRVTRASRGCG